MAADIIIFLTVSIFVDASFRTSNVSNTQVGLLFRYLDNNNYWSFRFQNSNPTFSVSIDKYISGVQYNITQSNVSFDNSNLFG